MVVKPPISEEIAEPAASPAKTVTHLAVLELRALDLRGRLIHAEGFHDGHQIGDEERYENRRVEIETAIRHKLGRPSHGLEATAEKSAMPNARDSAVPTTSAIRYDSAFTMPLPNWESTTTSTQVMMETASVFGSAKPLSPGAPPRNSLDVDPTGRRRRGR